MAKGTFTICALTFGPHLWLAQRTLLSLRSALKTSLARQHVAEFRLALNACTPEVVSWVEAWANVMASESGINSWLYLTRHNHFKYPIMRRMFRQPHWVESPAVMWFDDDSYMEEVDDIWWTGMAATISQVADLAGQVWLMPVQGNQLAWVKTQPWCNPAVPLTPPKRVRGKPAFEFCQGAWWMARTEILRKYDWPVAEIRHNGGDSMLGELARHQGLRMVRVISGKNSVHDGVRINADVRGRHSAHPRRGHHENRVGATYVGTPLDTSHQNFVCEIRQITP